MRRVLVTGARAVLLAGPTAIAFFTGGYFDGPREVAGVLAWLLVAVALVAAPRPLPRGTGGRLALAGLALLALWTLLSSTWAPIAGTAYHYGQRVVMYAGVLLAASALLRGRAPLRAVVPALAGGTLIVIGYGISERLLPGVLHFSRSVSAQGRLEQPLTYWNAMGELAALGFVLCAALAGDRSRPRWMRSGAAAAAVPLGMGLYISFSRGSLFACAAGLVALFVLVRRREQLAALAVCLGAGVLGSVAAAPFKGVTSLSGSLSTREGQGAVVFVLLVVIAAAAALAMARVDARVAGGELRLHPRAGWIALAVICAGLALAIVVGAKEGAGSPNGAGAARLASLQSNRYAYWGVAFRAFGDEPLRGVGAGGWSVYWLRYRHISEFAQDAHSLPLQTLAELGIVGFALLLAFVGGVGWSASDARRISPVLAGGPIAGLVTYLAHAPLDWDWEMPAVTLVALVLAGSVLGLAELARPNGR
ncbi:MAG TPA: O-antigen ligase family protein [Solirubrobacteraceae bacterium]|nr:O-antigen ligase family protein [Solirubrobacteraceae bacterium]